MAPVVFLVDRDRGSYTQAAVLYAHAFRAAGLGVEMRNLGDPRSGLDGRWVVHHTIGPLIRPVEGAVNTAVVFHEWSRYPNGWLEVLSRFDAVWAPSRHVADVLKTSGARVPICYVPPPLTVDVPATRERWVMARPIRLLAVGEPHFRKGWHLLMAGFLAAFPKTGDAQLTLKVSESCDWTPPRDDIRILRTRLSRAELHALYADHDAYVTASLGEGLGLPLAEAVMARLPVAANWWGGHRDIVQPGAFWEIACDVVPQVFCSQPSFYAAGQECAYSSADRIASTLLALVDASPQERERRATIAADSLRQTHSLERSADFVRRHVPDALKRP